MSNPFWRDKYPVVWCSLCVTYAAQCPACNASSCNGGGCDECAKDFDEFMALPFVNSKDFSNGPRP